MPNDVLSVNTTCAITSGLVVVGALYQMWSLWKPEKKNKPSLKLKQTTKILEDIIKKASMVSTQMSMQIQGIQMQAKQQGQVIPKEMLMAHIKQEFGGQYKQIVQSILDQSDSTEDSLEAAVNFYSARNAQVRHLRKTVRSIYYGMCSETDPESKEKEEALIPYNAAEEEKEEQKTAKNGAKATSTSPTSASGGPAIKGTDVIDMVGGDGGPPVGKGVLGLTGYEVIECIKRAIGAAKEKARNVCDELEGNGYTLKNEGVQMQVLQFMAMSFESSIVEIVAAVVAYKKKKEGGGGKEEEGGDSEAVGAATVEKAVSGDDGDDDEDDDDGDDDGDDICDVDDVDGGTSSSKSAKKAKEEKKAGGAGAAGAQVPPPLGASETEEVLLYAKAEMAGNETIGLLFQKEMSDLLSDFGVQMPAGF